MNFLYADCFNSNNLFPYPGFPESVGKVQSHRNRKHSNPHSTVLEQPCTLHIDKKTGKILFPFVLLFGVRIGGK